MNSLGLALARGHFRRAYGQDEALGVPEDGEVRRPVDEVGGEQLVELGDRAHGLGVERDDDVAIAQSGN